MKRWSEPLRMPAPRFDIDATWWNLSRQLGMIFTTVENAASDNSTTNKREIIMVNKGNLDEAIAAIGEELQWQEEEANSWKRRMRLDEYSTTSCVIRDV